MSRSEIPEVRQFNSVVEFGQYCLNTPRHKDARTSSNAGDTSWCGGLTFNGAADMAMTGGLWEEGAREMKHAMDITRDMFAAAPETLRARSVDGGSVCVPAAVMGHPLSMFKQADQIGAGKPVLSIGLSMVQAANTHSSDRINQGAAVMTAVEELERRGYRCEITSVYRTGCSNDDAIETWVSGEVLLKAADAPFNPVTLAFAFAHACWLRRLGFKMIETMGENGAAITHSMYGDASNTKEWKSSMASDFDITVPNVTGKAYRTPEMAFAVITEVFNQGLAHLIGDDHDDLL